MSGSTFLGGGDAYLTRLIFENIFYHDNPHACGISTAEKLRVIFGQVWYCFLL
jgi:hypothetical protein